nr:DNA-directed RNA polymerase II subunit RPB1-like [Bactrocera oleae]
MQTEIATLLFQYLVRFRLTTKYAAEESRLSAKALVWFMGEIDLLTKNLDQSNSGRLLNTNICKFRWEVLKLDYNITIFVSLDLKN